MCGINLWAWKDKSCELCQNLFDYDNYVDTDDIQKNLRRRGPDSYGNISTVTHSGYHRIQCAASVLQMRSGLQQQPLSFIPGWTKSRRNSKHTEEVGNNFEEKHEDEAYLCWNGEIYEQVQLFPSENAEGKGSHSKDVFMHDVADTTLVADYLRTSTVLNDDEINIDDESSEPHHQKFPLQHDSAQRHIANVMSQFYNAEFGFCILTKDGVFYGRDVWGRRSLLRWDCPKNCGSFQIVSVAEDFAQNLTTISTPATEIPNKSSREWTEVPPGVVHCILFSEPTQKIPELRYPKVSFPTPPLQEGFNIPPIPHASIVPQSPIEIISDVLWRVSIELESCLRRAVTIRLDQSPDRRSTGVLFSGGVDSVVLATLAADILSSQHRAEKLAVLAEARASQSSSSLRNLRCPPVPILYLYNVSFGPNHEKSADRDAALKSYQALRDKYESNTTSVGKADSDDSDQNHCDDDDDDNDKSIDDCDIKIIFRDIVVGWEDICKVEPHIRTLISPKSTVMDVNIATALWFASRGESVGKSDICTDHKNNLVENDRSPRVLLLGMGADELMGGYGRHRKAYDKGGWKQLQSELTMDQDRLWERNCGRDDRLCSDHGREARFPFLDAHVVRLLQETMANMDGLVCDFRLPPGVGDKRILRLVAQRLGMEHASGLVKRAIQFGSRISHLSDKKRFGSRRKAKGAAKI